MLGHDFLPFYFAGTCARTGHLEKLYNLNSTAAFEFRTAAENHLELGPGFGPWWNPPFAAWMFAPLSALPYLKARLAWWLFSLTCLIVSMFLLCRMLPGGWRTWGLVPLLMCCSMPLFQTFNHGQNTFFSLLLLTTVVTFWRAGKALESGLVCGLLYYKPQLGAIVAAVLICSQGRRALLGVAISGTSLLLINIVTMPGTLADWLHWLPINLHWMQEENHYLWDRHVTFKGFWRLLLQGKAMGPTSVWVKIPWMLCELALGGALAKAVWRTTRGKEANSSRAIDRLIAASIASMPLLMPFYFDYDLLLVSVAAVVCTADILRQSATPESKSDLRRIAWAWTILFLCVEVAAMVGGHTRIQLTVPALTVLAVMLIRRAIASNASLAKPTPQAVHRHNDHLEPEALAA